ncbi:hypothetical protein GCM10010524_52740 [Streptomyces mexicanus]
MSFLHPQGDQDVRAARLFQRQALRVRPVETGEAHRARRGVHPCGIQQVGQTHPFEGRARDPPPRDALHVAHDSGLGSARRSARV